MINVFIIDDEYELANLLTRCRQRDLQRLATDININEPEEKALLGRNARPPLADIGNTLNEDPAAVPRPNSALSFPNNSGRALTV